MFHWLTEHGQDTVQKVTALMNRHLEDNTGEDSLAMVLVPATNRSFQSVSSTFMDYIETASPIEGLAVSVREIERNNWRNLLINLVSWYAEVNKRTPAKAPWGIKCARTFLQFRMQKDAPMGKNPEQLARAEKTHERITMANSFLRLMTRYGIRRVMDVHGVTYSGGARHHSIRRLSALPLCQALGNLTQRMSTLLLILRISYIRRLFSLA